MIFRALAVVLCTLACTWLAHAVGPWLAILIWSTFSAVVCASIGFLLMRSPVGVVGPVNRIAGPVLFLGVAFAKGRLERMVLASIVGWSVVGVIAVLAAGREPASPVPAGSADGAPGPMTWSLLALSWLLVGFALCRVAVTLTWRPPPPSSLRAVLVLSAILVGSITLALLGRHGYALAVAGVPPLIVLGGYGLILLVMLLGGKRMRWN